MITLLDKIECEWKKGNTKKKRRGCGKKSYCEGCDFYKTQTKKKVTNSFPSKLKKKKNRRERKYTKVQISMEHFLEEAKEYLNQIDVYIRIDNTEKKSRHDEIISKLEKRLKHIGCTVHKKEEFDINEGHGECDIYGINDDLKWIFAIEVKRTNNQTHYEKAKKQLHKDYTFIKEKGYDLTNYQFIEMYAFNNKEKRKGYGIIKIKDCVKTA